jgi:hypothetical protein
MSVCSITVGYFTSPCANFLGFLAGPKPSVLGRGLRNSLFSGFFLTTSVVKKLYRLIFSFQHGSGRTALRRLKPPELRNANGSTKNPCLPPAIRLCRII